MTKTARPTTTRVPTMRAQGDRSLDVVAQIRYTRCQAQYAALSLVPVDELVPVALQRYLQWRTQSLIRALLCHNGLLINIRLPLPRKSSKHTRRGRREGAHNWRGVWCDKVCIQGFLIVSALVAGRGFTVGLESHLRRRVEAKS